MATSTTTASSGPSTQFVPWYQLTSNELHQHSHDNQQAEFTWLLEDTCQQLFSTVFSGLKECQIALGATETGEAKQTTSSNNNDNTNNTGNSAAPGSSVSTGPFKLVVSSGRLDIMKGILVRSGTALADFDVKVSFSAVSSSASSSSSSSTGIINGPGVQGCITGQSSLVSTFHHWGFGNSSHNNSKSNQHSNHNTHNDHSSSSGSGSVEIEQVDKYSYNPGNSSKSPYTPFIISMKPSAGSLPLKQLVSAVGYLNQAIECIGQQDHKHEQKKLNSNENTGDSNTNHDGKNSNGLIDSKRLGHEAMECASFRLSRLYQLVQAAANSLKGPEQPSFVPKPLLSLGLASSNVSSIKSSRIDTPNLSGASTPFKATNPMEAYSNSLDIPVLKIESDDSSAGLSSPKREAGESSGHEHDQEISKGPSSNLLESVTTDYATNPACLESDMPSNTIVSFYVSDGCIVTEIRVLEPLEREHGAGHETPLSFRWFKGMTSRNASHTKLNAHHNLNSDVGSNSAASSSTLSPSVDTGASTSLSANDNTHKQTIYTLPGFYPQLLKGRKIKDYIRVESQDPNLIMATAKLRALSCLIATLKKRIDLLTEGGL